ncbi:glycosyltransferase family 4 protein [Candidatus Bathyarchaeota archaeon]|nr:glycosyltransferase family 4 protein [Candidatus Bathyarchaeota archaeon]
MRVKIVTKMDWPSFRNVAMQVRKALSSYCSCTIYDRTNVEPGGNILFIGTVFHQTLNFLNKFLGQSDIVFYGTTEGHSFVDEASLEVAKQIKIVAVSNFVKQMLEEIGIPVAGVVHHGLDMDDRRVDTQFYKVLKKKLRNKKIIFTASANHSRKGLDNLLYGYHLVEQEIKNTYLILHSEPTGYYNISKMAEDLKFKHLWLTNLFGKLSPSQLNAFYKLCSVYVQPSYSEGFGLPILEAFRFNKPVIAVDAPPFNEVIEHGKSGILVPLSKITWSNFANLVLFKMHMYRAEDLAQAILELMTNQQQITKMQENIQKEKHNWSVKKLYPELLNYFT